MGVFGGVEGPLAGGKRDKSSYSCVCEERCERRGERGEGVGWLRTVWHLMH